MSKIKEKISDYLIWLGAIIVIIIVIIEAFITNWLLGIFVIGLSLIFIGFGIDFEKREREKYWWFNKIGFTADWYEEY